MLITFYTHGLVPHHLSFPCQNLVSEATAADQTTSLFPHSVFHLREPFASHEVAESDRERLEARIFWHGMKRVRLVLVAEMGAVYDHDRMSLVHSCPLHGEVVKENEDGENPFVDHRHPYLYPRPSLYPFFSLEGLEISPFRDAEAATLNSSRQTCLPCGSWERVWSYPLVHLDDAQNLLQGV